MPEDPYAAYQEPKADPYAAYQSPAVPDSQQRHVGPQAHAMAQEFMAKHPELAKDAQALLDHGTDEGPGVLAGIGKFLASPIASLKNAPAAVMDWFKNGPKPSGGFSGDNPVEQAYGNALMALTPTAEGTPEIPKAGTKGLEPGTMVQAAREAVPETRSSLAIDPMTAHVVNRVLPGAGTAARTVGRIVDSLRKDPAPEPLVYRTAAPSPIRAAIQDAIRNMPAPTVEPPPPVAAPPASLPSGRAVGGLANAKTAVPPEVIADLMRESEVPPAAPPNTPGLPPRMAGPVTATPEAAAPVNGNPRMQSYVYEPEDVDPTASKGMPGAVEEPLQQMAKASELPKPAGFNQEMAGFVKRMAEISRNKDVPGLQTVIQDMEQYRDAGGPKLNVDYKIIDSAIKQGYSTLNKVSKPTAQEMAAPFEPDTAKNIAMSEDAAARGAEIKSGRQDIRAQKMADYMKAQGYHTPEQAQMLEQSPQLWESIGKNAGVLKPSKVTIGKAKAILGWD